MDPFMMNRGFEDQLFGNDQTSNPSSRASRPSTTVAYRSNNKPFIRPSRVDLSRQNSSSTYGGSSMTKLKRSHSVVAHSPTHSDRYPASKTRPRARSHYITGSSNNEPLEFDLPPPATLFQNNNQFSLSTLNVAEYPNVFLSQPGQQEEHFLTALDESSPNQTQNHPRQQQQQQQHIQQRLGNYQDDLVSQIYMGKEVQETFQESPSLNPSPYLPSEHHEVLEDKLNEDQEKQKCDDEDYEHSFEADDEAIDKKFKTTFVSRMTRMKYLTCSLLLVLFLSACLVLNSFPLFTCHHTGSVCFPQLTIQLTDKSPAAKNALLTVREALKVISYLAIDFGDNTSELDMINTRLDSYYQNKIIDTFSVNTIFHLNFLGYCRLGFKKGKNFCMRSYGLDLLSVFVRDAGVQLGELTKTNVDIMGDSFAIAYELAISGFNEFSNKENHESVEYINYAILLQKLSKGLGFLTMAQFTITGVLLLGSIMLILFKNDTIGKKLKPPKIYKIRKYLTAIMVSLSFINLLVGFLMCSLTLEFILRLSEVGQSVGIANINRASGFSFIVASFSIQVLNTLLILCLANGLRKRVY